MPYPVYIAGSGSGSTSSSSSSGCCPLVANFQLIFEAEQSTSLLVGYGWLTQCPNKSFKDIQGVINEHLVYGDGSSPFLAPYPFNQIVYDNPVELYIADPSKADPSLPRWPGGSFIDEYSIPNISKPYSAASYSIVQKYVFNGPCTNGRDVVIGGPYTITRSVSKDSAGNWVYNCSKDGFALTPYILPS